jgi:hypothetical protein
VFAADAPELLVEVEAIELSRGARAARAPGAAAAAAEPPVAGPAAFARRRGRPRAGTPALFGPEAEPGSAGNALLSP